MKTKKPQTDRPRDRRRRARIEGILDQSMALLLNEGADALTMRRLADSLDLTAGAIYRYFPSKGAILSELSHRALKRLSVKMDREEARIRTQQADDHSSEAALHLVLGRSWAYWQFCLEEPGTFRLINLLLTDPRQFISDSDQHADFMSAVFAPIASMAALLDGAAGVGALNSEEPGIARALGVLSSLNGTLLLLKLADAAPVGFDPAQTLKLLLSGLLQGWGAERARVQSAWDQMEDRSV